MHDPSYIIDFFCSKTSKQTSYTTFLSLSNTHQPLLMRPYSPHYLRALNATFKSTARSHLTSKPLARMAATTPSADEAKIENTNINTAPNVTLTSHQKTLVGCVLDLFAGRPSLAKLQLWRDDAVFEDPLAKAQGRTEFEAQWYGLQTAFSEIERLSHQVTSAGEPLEMDLKNRYVVKGVGSEKVVDSKILIYTEEGRIRMVQDKWDGSLPEGKVADVSCSFLLLLLVAMSWVEVRDECILFRAWCLRRAKRGMRYVQPVVKTLRCDSKHSPLRRFLPRKSC